MLESSSIHQHWLLGSMGCKAEPQLRNATDPGARYIRKVPEKKKTKNQGQQHQIDEQDLPGVGVIKKSFKKLELRVNLPTAIVLSNWEDHDSVP